jgi:class 3 adenylate cyclase/tetratricopeptide (TPR) repeat protein
VTPTTPELRVVSVLFVDLVGYTALSESRDAEDMRELLSRYFDSARTIVARYGGSIEKFIGDAVMAVWGTPVAREDDAERAVRAALEIVDAVAAFGAEVGIAALEARGGVVTGQVASVATAHEGLVVGDSVNTAARVQSVADPGTVFVDEITRQVTAAAIGYEDAGEHVVKGKTKPLRLWRAARVVAGIGGTQREQGLQAPLVGRDPDLRLLKELFHGGIARKAARLVAVTGAAGVGKSRLLRELEIYADGLADTFLWHSGRCLSYGDGVAYWALAEMVRQRLAIAEEASAEEASEKLVLGLARWVPDAGEREFLAPRLGALLGVADPGVGRAELFAGWRLFFERLAAHEPVVLSFEDLQWADEGILDFIDHLLDWSAACPIFILTLARPELAQRREGWPGGRRGATVLPLEPLATSAIGELLDSVADDLPHGVRERIVSQSEGIPLYTVEIVRALAARGALTERGDGRLVPAGGELGELDVPASLSSLLAARLDALDAEEREVVKSMAIFAGDFPRAAVVAVCQVPEERLDAVLAALVRKQVLAIRADPLSPDRGQYAFAQALLRTVAYEMISRKDRKPRHRAAAEHLRRVFPGDGEEVAEVIAAHYLDAYRSAQDDPDADELRTESVAALRRAGQRAAIVGAPESAERSYITAIGLVDSDVERADLRRAAGDMAMRAGRYEAALAHFETASAEHTSAGREREAALLARPIGRALLRMGRLEDAIERMTAALEVLGADRIDADVGELNGALANALLFAGHPERVGAAIEAALRVAEALELPEVLCRALTSKGVMYTEMGRTEEARLLLDGAVAIGERHDLADAVMVARANGANLRLQWDLPGAVEGYAEALALARRHGDRGRERLSAGGLMYTLLAVGRWGEIERLATEVLGNEGGPQPRTEVQHYSLALLHALRGEHDAARASLERLAAWEDTDDAEYRAMGASARLVVDRIAGRDEAVLERGQTLIRHWIATLGASNEAVRNAWPETLEAALSLGRLDAAEDLLAILDEEPRGRVPPYLHAQLARGRALTAAAAERHHTVEADFGTATRGLSSLGYPYWLARAQTDLGAWLIDQHRADEAAPLLADAVATFSSLGAAPALARAQALEAAQAAAVQAGAIA